MTPNADKNKKASSASQNNSHLSPEPQRAPPPSSIGGGALRNSDNAITATPTPDQHIDRSRL